MPIVRVTTTKTDIPADLEKKFADLIVKLFPNKPLSHVFVMVSPGTKIYNNPRSPTGTEDLVLCEVQSMQAFTKDNVESTKTEFINFLSSEIGVEKSKILVALTAVPDDFAGLGE